MAVAPTLVDSLPCLPPARLQVLAITFPATFGGLHNRTHTVLAAPGTQQDEAFIESVYEVGAVGWRWAG